MLDALAGVSLFAGLKRAELAPLAAATVPRSHPAHAIIVREGDRAESLQIVLSGQVKVFVSGDDGREVVLTTMGPGNYFGEMMLDDELRSASIMTLEPCRVAVVSRDVFRDFLAHHPDASLALIRNLIGRIRAMNERFRDLALLDAYGRVSKLLHSVAHDAGGYRVVDGLTQQDIGDRVGASREMINRVIKELEADGHIRREGRRIVILRAPAPGR